MLKRWQKLAANTPLCLGARWLIPGNVHHTQEKKKNMKSLILKMLVLLMSYVSQKTDRGQEYALHNMMAHDFFGERVQWMLCPQPVERKTQTLLKSRLSANPIRAGHPPKSITVSIVSLQRSSACVFQIHSLRVCQNPLKNPPRITLSSVYQSRIKHYAMQYLINNK